MSLLRDLAPQGWLGGAMGLLGTTSALGTAFGPSLGGALLSWLGWRAAFWGLTGVAAVTLVLALGLLPTGLHTPEPASAIWTGFQLFLAASNTAVLATTAEGKRGRVSGLLGLSRSLGQMTGASEMPGLFSAFLHIPLRPRPPRPQWHRRFP